MNLATQIARWHRYWRTATSAQDVERQLKRLYWLQEFTFAAGSSIRPEQVAALHQQVELGEKKLAELNGDFACPKTPCHARLEVIENAGRSHGHSACPQGFDFEATEANA